jgi:hypothetical protein
VDASDMTFGSFLLMLLTEISAPAVKIEDISVLMAPIATSYCYLHCLQRDARWSVKSTVL